LKIDTPKKGEV